ncbi:unnamed protein product [Candida verbasci]|uniref:Uncharacterized protein n=1 Tax=Candida verbasci TaxID=1227364 RepID=A0A9W4TYH0_9ASCO|nr:unnamed protein product [Candida verbasci]
MTELPNPHEYTAIKGLMRLLAYQNNGPADGTGSHVLAAQARNLLGPHTPPIMVQYSTATQMNLFGDYPDHRDIAPSALFIALFAIVMLLHLTIFIINYSRGHYFWLSLGWVFYAACRMIGFALRIVWSYDLTQTAIGITSEVFLIVPTVLIVSFNLILAQRIFTWRHPVGGSCRIFWALMLTLYAVVAGVVAMTIVASAGINIYLLGEPNFARYKKVIMCTSILIICYSLTSISLLALAYFLKPTTNDENLYTYQPWWIESFAPTYFVKKGEPQIAAASFLKRNHNHRHAIRVIAATHNHHKQVKGLTNQRGTLTHNVSIIIVTITTIIIFVDSILRAVVVFQARMKYFTSNVGKAPVMYVFWGAFEIIINLLYIIGRVDLRFYRPDRLPKDVRNIVTAEQSLYTSEIEDEDEEMSKHEDTKFENEEEEEDEFFFDDDEDDGFEFNTPAQKTTAPYPTKEKLDTESEFHF